MRLNHNSLNPFLVDDVDLDWFKSKYWDNHYKIQELTAENARLELKMTEVMLKKKKARRSAVKTF